MFDRDPKECRRCGAPLRVSIMSKFNEDVLCLECKEDETLAPGYPAACAAEEAEVRAKNYNFPGVGLSREASAFLAERRARRRV